TPIEKPIGDITKMPPRPKDVAIFDVLSPLLSKKFTSEFNGGETAGLEQMANYFASSAPSNYKETRNGLDGWDYSTKFSPWLALGCLSAKSVLAALAQYQQAQCEQSGSSDWIKYELMWREYFQWYGHKYGHRLFQFRGIKDSSPNTAFYPERFRRWCEGNTPYPLVNALMNQLRQTGYMSNRGRQIAASCLTNELSLDWRYGASYFEEHLIDYDIASNWGNWQYLAGVGADPQGHRHFNIEKQTDDYDPDRTFINKWGGDKFDGGLDSV
ncbi:DASH family cryptochrome, partial [Photobacterium sanctipauli]